MQLFGSKSTARPHLAILALGFLGIPHAADAQVKIDGYVVAHQACEAYQSKNKLTNPGNILTEENKAYEALGINKPGGDFFLIKVPGAPVTEERWLSASCGVHVLVSDQNPNTTTTASPSDVIPETNQAESTDNLLVLSWQPAFCETRPNKIECRNLNDGLLPVTSQQLSIHGLWPQPKSNDYCSVPAEVRAKDSPATWDQLPAPHIDMETADILAVVMPGFASHLHHHEWIKHGTCYHAEGGADEYYDDSLYLTSLVNESPVVELLTANIGHELTASEIRAALDEAFGEGAGKRVNIKCTNDGSRVILTELWINLAGQITQESELGTLMRAAREAPTGCKRMTIDPIGLQ